MRNRLLPMLFGYKRISRADGTPSVDLQRDALLDACIEPGQMCKDQVSGEFDDRPGLSGGLKAALILGILQLQRQ